MRWLLFGLILMVSVSSFSQDLSGTIVVRKKQDLQPRVSGKMGGKITREEFCVPFGIQVRAPHVIVTEYQITYWSVNGEKKYMFKGNHFSDEICVDVSRMKEGELINIYQIMGMDTLSGQEVRLPSIRFEIQASENSTQRIINDTSETGIRLFVLDRTINNANKKVCIIIDKETNQGFYVEEDGTPESIMLTVLNDQEGKYQRGDLIKKGNMLEFSVILNEDQKESLTFLCSAPENNRMMVEKIRKTDGVPVQTSRQLYLDPTVNNPRISNEVIKPEENEY